MISPFYILKNTVLYLFQKTKLLPSLRYRLNTRSHYFQIFKQKTLYPLVKTGIKVCLFLTLALPSNATPLKVTIDPGHGGTDAGAVRGHNRESDIVLEISNLVAKKLKDDLRFQVKMTRTKDTTVPLQERVKMTREYNPDIFLSIHANSHYNFRAQGAEFYIQDKIPLSADPLLTKERVPSSHREENGIVSSILKDLEKTAAFYEGLELAKILKREWDKQIPSTPTHVKKAPLYILEELDMPGILVEAGFLSHISEGYWLLESRAHHKIANIIYMALIKYKEKLDKQNLPTHITAHAKR